MVTYAISKYSANKDRVYSTGDSSGGMMTELLLAVYPDIFKAGAAFAGMPAGCRGANESSTAMGYSGACAGGSVTHTAQEWGDVVRKMDPGYTGHRPRVQLFHGDADTTIRYANFTEAIKEWTNVLGLAASPTSTPPNVTLGTHQATRQQWQSACGYLVLEGFTSLGGDHGPSDALFKAQYVIPFLGLDKTGAVDPEVQQCGNGGTGGGSGTDAGADAARDGGSGGSSGAGGAGGRGGTGGGAGGAGGSAGTGGGGNSGGMAGTTATGGRGGPVDAGDGSGGGGAQGRGGSQGTGGTGGVGGNGGSAGGASDRGGAGGSGAGGTAVIGSGGASNGGAPGGTGGTDSGGCSCALSAAASSGHFATAAVAAGLLLAAVLRPRRRRSGEKSNRPARR
jgi:hypothetical protein